MAGAKWHREGKGKGKGVLPRKVEGQAATSKVAKAKGKSKKIKYS